MSLPRGLWTHAPQDMHRRASGMLPRSAVVMVSGLVVSGLLLAACSSDGEPAAADPESPSASSTPTPEPPPTTLLSGRRGKDHQVLAVKVDNTVNAHPQAGLMAADVVYMEEVEWGLTRLMGVYSSRYPRAIGPVRSARESDLDILRQYGKVAFAFSGSNPAIVREINEAPLYPLSNDAGANGYSRSPDRAAPWNLFGNPEELLNGAKKAVDAKDVGSTFSDETPDGGRRVRSFTAFWPSARAQFDWSQKEGRWLLSMDGQKSMSTEGPQLGGTTVVIQSVDVHPSELGDAYGGITPTTETVGKGDAWMFRDGKVWNVTWSRPTAADGTSFEYKGKPVDFDPGQVWFLLLDKDKRPQIR